MGRDSETTPGGELRLLPNQITCVRLALVPVLWALALLGQPWWLGAGLLLAGVTDALDGFVARRLGQCTAFGSRLDSLADNLIMPSAMIWLAMLRPGALAGRPGLLALAGAVYAVSISVGWLKFRRIGNLHLFSAKAAAPIVWAFAIYSFLSEASQPAFYYAAIGLFTLSAAEALLVQLTRSEVDEHVGSILLSRSRETKRPAVCAARPR